MQDWLFWAFLLPFFFDKQLLFGLCFSLTLWCTDGCGKCKIQRLYATAWPLMISARFSRIWNHNFLREAGVSRVPDGHRVSSCFCYIFLFMSPVCMQMHKQMPALTLLVAGRLTAGLSAWEAVGTVMSRCLQVCAVMSFFSFVLTNIHSELLAVLEN